MQSNSGFELKAMQITRGIPPSQCTPCQTEDISCLTPCLEIHTSRTLMKMWARHVFQRIFFFFIIIFNPSEIKTEGSILRERVRRL